MAINHMIKMAMLNRKPSPRYFYIAPYLKQAKLIAWDYFKHYARPIQGIKFNESELFAELLNGAKIWLFGADNPEAGRGTYADGVVLDEYAQIKPEVYGEIIRPALSDRNGWTLFMGTPKGQNQLYDIYNKALQMMQDGNPDWWCGLYRADETSVIPEEELAQLKTLLNESTYRQEFLCDFTAAADNVLITIDQVINACNKKFNPNEIMGSPRIIGVDPARFGDDRSVILRREGLVAYEPKIFTKIDNMTLVGRLTQEIDDFNPDAVFVDAGRGEGVIDRCRQLGYNVIEVNFGGVASKQNHYVNKRAEMWDLMREWITAGGSLPDNRDLKSDLVTPTYDYDPSNRIRLESKEKIKERLGKSPDIADALALTFAFPVKRKSMITEKKEFANGKKEYDPFSSIEQKNQINPVSGRF
ncbi:MAG: hypothetical protein IPP74_13530 [Alphaproteobacteria bacterium]|nr:hypothetical protein [Alphaproteobacteria bacterium]